MVCVTVLGQSALLASRETAGLLNTCGGGDERIRGEHAARKGGMKEVAKSFTRVGDSVVVHVRVRPRPELDFSGPVPSWRDNERRRGERRRARQGGGQALPLVFERAELSVKFLQFPVLLGLKGHHLLNVPTQRGQ